MTREEAIEGFRHSISMSKLDLKVNKKNMSIEREIMVLNSIARNEMAIEALEQEPCEDAISREELLKAIDTWDRFGVDDTNSLFRLDNLSLPHYVPYIHYDDVIKCIKGIPSVKSQEPKTERCKDCKWWKDSDGVYRRGVKAESRCPINRKEVLEGNGYCYMYEPQERSENGSN